MMSTEYTPPPLPTKFPTMLNVFSTPRLCLSKCYLLVEFVPRVKTTKQEIGRKNIGKYNIYDMSTLLLDTGLVY